MSQDDLVDIFRAPLVRPLGNLVILAGMLENSLRELAAEFCGGNEAAAAETLKKKNDKAYEWLREQVVAVEKKIPDHSRAELLGRRKSSLGPRVESAFKRLERALKMRARFVHDEWSVGLGRHGATLGLRGFPRTKNARLHHKAADPVQVWALAREFRELNQIFGDAATILRDQREQGCGS